MRHTQSTRLAQMFSLGLLASLGCDESEEDLSLRAGVLDQDELQECEPIPGGGGCEGCVTCWGLRPGQICFRPASRVVGATISPEDDVSLAELFLNGGWRFETAQNKTLCTSETCPATAVPSLGASVDVFGFLSTRRKLPDKLVFTDDEVEYGLDLPSHDIPLWSALLASEILTAPEVLEPGPITRGLAHITYPAADGGFASCSGFLVSQRHMVTALHCFTDASPIPGCPFEPASSKVMIPSKLLIRVGGVEGPDGGSFASDQIRDAVAVYGYTDHELDLALIELDHDVDGAPFKLAKHYQGEGFEAYGYGAAGMPIGGGPGVYDWGRLKRMPLALEDRTPEFLRLSAPEGVRGPCRGDSGGPVLRGGEAVGMLIARDINPVSGHLPSLSAPGIELIAGRSFAFTNHNACGRGGPGDEIRYLAVNLTAPEIRAWIDELIDESSLVDPTPSPLDPVPLEPPSHDE